MKTIITIVAALALALCLTGCGSSRPEDKAAKEQEQVVKLLPPGYTNLKPLGNQWFYFELDVAGKRQFMARYWTGSHSEYGIVVTELKGEK